MNEEAIVLKAKEFVQKELQNAEAGHDWWHIDRVYNNALLLAENEPVNFLVLRLACLLHDVGDAKFHNGDESVGLEKIKSFLSEVSVSEEIYNHVINIVENISFRKHFEPTGFRSMELDILQDADRLDAIGAVGIARAFSFGGFKGNTFYNPEVLPNMNMDAKSYKKGENPTINHFYEKLLRLKSMMKTTKGRQLAVERHQFMIHFLSRFYLESGIDPSIYENFEKQI